MNPGRVWEIPRRAKGKAAIGLKKRKVEKPRAFASQAHQKETANRQGNLMKEMKNWNLKASPPAASRGPEFVPGGLR